jgi:hypothetical protein
VILVETEIARDEQDWRHFAFCAKPPVFEKPDLTNWRTASANHAHTGLQSPDRAAGA